MRRTEEAEIWIGNGCVSSQDWDARNRAAAVRAARRGCGVMVRGNPCSPGVEARAELNSLDMAEGNGYGIGSVGGLGRFTHAQQCAHHNLHLFFSSVAVAGDAGLHFARR